MCTECARDTDDAADIPVSVVLTQQTFRQALDAIEAALDLRPQRIQVVRRGQTVVNTPGLTPARNGMG